MGACVPTNICGDIEKYPPKPPVVDSSNRYSAPGIVEFTFRMLHCSVDGFGSCLYDDNATCRQEAQNSSPTELSMGACVPTNMCGDI